MTTLNSAPITLLAGVPGKVIVPIMFQYRSTLNVNFASNVTGSLRWAAQAIDIAGPSLLFNGGTNPGLFCGMMPGLVTILANTIDNQNSALILRGTIDSASGGGTSTLTGTLYYALA
jgi:hypothetical protein